MIPSHLLGVDNGAVVVAIIFIVVCAFAWFGSPARQARKHARRMAEDWPQRELVSGEIEWHTIEMRSTPEGVIWTIDGVEYPAKPYVPREPQMRLIHQLSNDPSGIEDHWKRWRP